MAKLVAVVLAIGLVAAFSSIQLAFAGRYSGLNLFKSSRVTKLLEKEAGERTRDEWERLVKAANEALSNGKIMPIKSALEIFQQVNGDHFAKLNRKEAEILINIHNVSEDDCKGERSLLSREFGNLLSRVIVNERKFSELYKAVKASLNHYTELCGLEDRYKKIVQRSVSNKSGKTASVGKESTLANQLLGESHSSLEKRVDTFRDSLIWEMSLINDPKFGLVSDISCEDDEAFMAKIMKGIKRTYSISLNKYANEVFDNYLSACGYEDRYKLVVEKLGVNDETLHLASYLKQSYPGYDESKLLPMIKLVFDSTAFNLPDKRDCSDFSLTDALVDKARILEPYQKVYPMLLAYVEVVLGEHLAICGFLDQFANRIKRFMKRQAKNWKLIESWIGDQIETDVDHKPKENPLNEAGEHSEELVENACRRLWNQTYGSLVDLVVIQYGRPAFMILESREIEPWLRNLYHCASKLNKTDEYVVQKLAKLITSISKGKITIDGERSGLYSN